MPASFPSKLFIIRFSFFLWLYIADKALGHIKVGDTAVLSHQVLRLRNCFFNRGKGLKAQSSGNLKVGGSSEESFANMIETV